MTNEQDGEPCMHYDELQVNRAHFDQARLAHGSLRGPEPGEILCKIDRFALTANNVTYALAGDRIGYWNFFPPLADIAKTRPEEWGIVPVWGFADVVESAHPDIAIGTRFWGFLPMASHIIMRPQSVTARAFIDHAPHRQPLPEVYNRYAITNQDRPELMAMEDARSILFPLFTTSYVLFDFLDDNRFFGASQVIIGSASSKTGLGLADLVHRQANDRIKLIGLTSPGNLGFVRGLAIYDQVLPYEEVAQLAPNIATAFVDMAGSGPTTAAIHAHFAEHLTASIRVGMTHWDSDRDMTPAKGARPQIFFAPAQIIKREKDWGPGEIMRRAQAECVRMAQSLGSQLVITRVQGAQAVADSYRAMVAGKVSPSAGLILSF